MKVIDETNNEYGELKVIRRATADECKKAGKHDGKAYWLCKCSCKKEIIVLGRSLRNGATTSCGHATTGFKDEKDNVYGEWKVIRRATEDEYTDFTGGAHWLCECSCGTRRVIPGYKLRGGYTKSCGHATTEFKDETGNYYGDWYVIEQAKSDGTWGAKWLCECTCGVRQIITGRDLRLHNSTNCGHLARRRHIPMDKLGLWLDNEKLSDEIKQFNEAHNRKIRTRELAEMLGSKNISSTLDMIRRRELVDLIDIERNGISSVELMLGDWIEEHTDKIVMRNVKVLEDNKEIDIYIPDLKIGIEINGDYWHSEQFKDREYHKNKTLAASKVGIRLIHIFESELNSLTKRKVIEEMLLKVINSNETEKIYARDCLIEQITNREAKEFNEMHHLQGHVNASVTFALKKDGRIISLMSFGKSRFDSNIEYELLRYTVNNEVVVIGGAERLLAAFRKLFSGSIVSYCDMTKFNGAVYERIGFKKVGWGNPNYIWYRRGEVLTRYECQKHKLIEDGLGTKDESEADIMHGLGYVRVYDCGSTKYILE